MTAFLKQIELLDDERRLVSALDLFFIEMDGTRYKYTVAYMPYFLICVEQEHSNEVTQFLKTKFGADIANIEQLHKEDLDLPNHLSGLKQFYLKLSFYSQNSLTKIRRILMNALENNLERSKKNDIFAQMLIANYAQNSTTKGGSRQSEPTDFVLDIREYDVPYHVRVSIDLKIFCGMWYDIEIKSKNKMVPTVKSRPDILERPEPVVLAFDIETTKLPLKFPDAQSDQIIMISYMIDGQGYLITNREVISIDVNDFEYTPKPEFEGNFVVFNEPNEKGTIEKFFSHVMQVRPHIFVTFNGDFFDWPFIEIRASKHGLDMDEEIGFAKSREGVYLCRPAIHMDCLCWVKRDSYLPVGSQGLKAVAKAKLHYDPIELDPEDMCKMAVSEPQLLSNYSVSDAIATYYLYMKYVHPFIFALNTIIPMEPDEVLRKGSGTLCETLLMVEAYHANIVFPNKQKDEQSKFSSDGHLIDSETYVGGHVEALECGVYRADIPCRFRLDRNMITQLTDSISSVLEHAIVNEEGVPLDAVENLEEVSNEIKQALKGLYEIPNRLEQPVIYHLDVGAMYPNIILTNRLQPSAVVNDAECAACDFNTPDAKCQRKMKWHWRGDMLPATKNELQRIKQQLEMEKFPPLQAGGSVRSFHELAQEDQAACEKKRLSDYCRKVYKKTKVVKLEERTSTICQKENSFYVDTVRAFRDRRYDYKGLTKVAKKAVNEAVQKGDAAEIKAAKSKEVLYDSLQLAHKCILNSFYGYVMRKGARWHSMPMAGIVCLTGSHIIQKARNIVERIGRPLELDTDGIWCILPASFPQVFTIRSSHKGKNSFNVSYPNAVLNNMINHYFTNEQYHELISNDSVTNAPEYKIRSENSIFFEVDGPYLAMVLPAAKEEGKKLKKRYAVFNFDGSLAELKGFEVKRRGELQLIKNFQSSVFESFLSGTTLEECYDNVAKIANYWLDVLYSQGQNLPDCELFDLVSENRSMSKKLEDYGAQKSTSISTAKRLAEFLGDQMVKDAGLACKYVISKKPEGSPVTDRAIPLAIFQCEPSIRSCYLRRWLRDNTMGDADIREVLDWGYYIERLSGAIQKIITIPAAMQGLKNPVPRVLHPIWLHKKMMSGTDKLKQRHINEMFSTSSKSDKVNENINRLTAETSSLEDIPRKSPVKSRNEQKISSKKRTFSKIDSNDRNNWREILGQPPPIGETVTEIREWIAFQKKKWSYQLNNKKENIQNSKRIKFNNNNDGQSKKALTVSQFITRSKKNIHDSLWHIIQLTAEDDFGNFIVWAFIQDELYKIKLHIPRILYINQRSETVFDAPFNRKKVNALLPRSAPAKYVYRYTFEEKTFKCNGLSIIASVPMTDIEGVYETNISLESRFLIEIGCLCSIRKDTQNPRAGLMESDTYNFEQIESHTDINVYLEKSWHKIKKNFLYQYNSLGKRQIWGLFLPANKQVVICVLDQVRSNQMPNMNNLYSSERSIYLQKIMGSDGGIELLPEQMTFDIFMEVDIIQVYRHIQTSLRKYKENKRGPTLLCTQTSLDIQKLKVSIPMLSDFPNVKIHISDDASTLHGLDWQKQTARSMVRHFLNFNNVTNLMLEQSRYLNIPLGNIPADPVLKGTDLFYARLLKKNNFVIWWSTSNRPDLGGKENEDYKLQTEIDSSSIFTQNFPGCYNGICVALSIQNLALNALVQSHKILEMESGRSMIAFGVNIQATLEDVLFNRTKDLQNMSEFSSCGPALRILRKMVNGWLREVSINRNILSDYHIAHFFRWIRSSTAFMYDPAVCKILTYLMEKMFVGILTEMERLGVVIIFADFKRIIISTKKKTVADALSYVEFIVQSIRKIEFYHGVQLSFEQSWKNLIWLDATNFAGQKCNLSAMENNDDNDVIFDATSLNINFSMGAEISEENTEFKEKFEQFIASLLKSLQETQSLSEATQNISHTIFDLATKLYQKYRKTDVKAVSKFVEAIITVIKVNKDLNDVVHILRRNLLKVVGVNEFSEDKELMNRQKFILSGFTCKACNEYRDLDIMNDKHKSLRNGMWVWLCNSCFVAYDNHEIETLVTDDITTRMATYTLQDLKCSQCNGVKNDNLCQSCKCGGKYMAIFKREEIKKTLQILLNVAKLHQMDMLQHFIINSF
ncbi:DNA polymerase epsilon catalytic subunit 1 isoform X2 [Episyrphus balteatus]|uniref:DNA polymerase epsilon catalytic subunit 1 isoform X2 n=1 Tax=Episyrphus balteatus TaxID=286459 RepID=UPI002485042B|nr:DNA polymerase epsilon catalytic subunit 1 isoform X2 [Episyrphus balteatus]